MAIDQTQKAEAIDYLLRQISFEALGQVNAHRDDPTWFRDQHFGLGLWVRNSLRRVGAISNGMISPLMLNGRR